MVKVVALLLIALAVQQAHASRRDWVGTAACGACHPKQLAAWRQTPHAATQPRTMGPQPVPSRCLMCHGTGEAPLGKAIAAEVGCEACHGAGKSYAEEDLMRNRPLAIVLGMTDVWTPQARAALCATCHVRRTASRPFDVAAPVHEVSP